MKLKIFEQIIDEKLRNLLTGFEPQNDFSYTLKDNYSFRNVFFTLRNFGSRISLNISILIKIYEFEEKWENHKEEMGLDTNSICYSFYNTLNHVSKSKYPTIEPHGIFIDNDEKWIQEFIEYVVSKHYLNFAQRLTDIKFCDQLLNKDIEITDEICKLSPIDGLPFRKIFVAAKANNPQLKKIRKAMRKHVEEDYIYGKEKNVEKLCKIKPVFEKLFGLDD